MEGFVDILVVRSKSHLVVNTTVGLKTKKSRLKFSKNSSLFLKIVFHALNHLT